jgi:predicted secreted protein
MRFDETANGSEVRLRLGQELEIVLAETRTTGYRWDIVEGGAPVCRLVSDAFEADGSAPGAPGRHTWRIGAAEAGTGTFSLAYRRQFGGGEPARRFTLRVVVN